MRAFLVFSKTPHSAASELDLHCLHISPKEIDKLIIFRLGSSLKMINLSISFEIDKLIIFRLGSSLKMSNLSISFVFKLATKVIKYQPHLQIITQNDVILKR